MPLSNCDKDSSQKSKSFNNCSDSNTDLGFLQHSSVNDFHRVISALPASLKFEVFADRLKLVRTVLRTNDLA